MPKKTELQFDQPSVVRKRRERYEEYRDVIQESRYGVVDWIIVVCKCGSIKLPNAPAR